MGSVERPQGSRKYFMSDTDLHNLIMERLATIAEPCGIAMRLAINICEMGLVEAVSISGGHVKVTLCLTDPACVHFSSLQHYICDVLTDVEGVNDVEVTQTTKVLWTPDRVTRRLLPS